MLYMIVSAAREEQRHVWVMYLLVRTAVATMCAQDVPHRDRELQAAIMQGLRMTLCHDTLAGSA
jgi:hypothetical protein